MVNFEVQEDSSGNCNFEITPKNGKLHSTFSSFKGIMKPGGKKEITVKFTPEEAKVIISTAIFTFTEGEKTC